MSSTDRLLELLVPLGVYSFADGSYSLGELKAIGAEIDLSKSVLENIEQDSCLLTAAADVLAAYGKLFGFALPSADTETLRKAIVYLTNISGDCFTLAAINKAIAECGINAVVEERGDGVIVRFPGVMGVPEEIDRMKAVIELVIPAHLQAEYVFVYLTWQQAGGVTWQQAAEYSWFDFALLEMDEQ